MYEGGEESKNITELEKKDLGQIFELLFIDKDFVDQVRKKIRNEISWPFAKDEITRIIQGINESTIWDRIVGENSVAALRNDYLIVKD